MPNSDRPASVGTMCFPWAIRKPCFFSPPMISALLAQGRRAWLRRSPAPNPEDTVLEVYFNDPEWFRQKVWVTYYFSEASDAAKEKFHEIKRLHYSEHQITKFDNENMPLYDLSRDDISHENVRDAVIDAADRSPFEILEVVRYSDESCIVLLKPTSRVRGLLFPQEQRLLIRQAIEQHTANKEKAAGQRLTNEEKDFGCNLDDLKKDFPDIHRYLTENFVSSGANAADQIRRHQNSRGSVDR
jgi:hypothetical protein